MLEVLKESLNPDHHTRCCWCDDSDQQHRLHAQHQDEEALNDGDTTPHHRTGL